MSSDEKPTSPVRGLVKQHSFAQLPVYKIASVRLKKNERFSQMVSQVLLEKHRDSPNEEKPGKAIFQFDQIRFTGNVFRKFLLYRDIHGFFQLAEHPNIFMMFVFAEETNERFYDIYKCDSVDDVRMIRDLLILSGTNEFRILGLLDTRLAFRSDVDLDDGNSSDSNKVRNSPGQIVQDPSSYQNAITPESALITGVAPSTPRASLTGQAVSAAQASLTGQAPPTVGASLPGQSLKAAQGSQSGEAMMTSQVSQGGESSQTGHAVTANNVPTTNSKPTTSYHSKIRCTSMRRGSSATESVPDAQTSTSDPATKKYEIVKMIGKLSVGTTLIDSESVYMYAFSKRGEDKKNRSGVCVYTYDA